MTPRRAPLFWRVFAVNAGVLVAVALVLVFAPVTISARVEVKEALLVALSLAVSLAANVILLRHALAPLDRLAERMEVVDLLRPGQRLPQTRGVVGRVVDAFNRMLDRLETERLQATTRALAAQETERVAIARNLHDEVGQLLTGVLLQLESIAEAAPQRRADVDEAKDAVRRAIGEVRRISSELRPEMLEHLGLTSALTELSRAFARRTGIQVERGLERVDGLTRDQELAIYRIAQEALTNVARHANARHVELSLRQTAGGVALRVVDDGRGLPPAEVAQEHGGLRSMRERAVLVGARLAIEPAAGGGVEVRLQLPAGAEAPAALTARR